MKSIIDVSVKKSKDSAKLRCLLGVVILVVAVVFLLEKLDALPINIFAGVGIVGMILAVIMVQAVVSGVIEGQISDILFPIAILCIIFEEPWGLEKITPWPVLIAALLGTIALKMILPNQDKIMSYTNDVENSNHREENPNFVQYSIFVGDGVKYITSKQLERVELRTFIGDMDVFLDKAEGAGDKVVVDIHEKIGDMNLYIPKTWKIENKMTSFIGDYYEDGEEAEECTTVMELTGFSRIGDLRVHRV